METPADVAYIATHDTTSTDSPSPEEAAFHAQWATADTSSLRPNRLPLAKPQRAWERRPRIPSSRIISRVGTVWKRPSAMAQPIFVPPYIRTNFLRRESSSPRVAVKKLRLDNEFCVGPSVSQWDVRGSPTRKIVTRSGASDGEALLALGDYEDEADGLDGEPATEELRDVTIEILNEDGTVVEADEYSLVEEAREWEDVAEEASRNDALVHVSEAIDHQRPHITASTAEPSASRPFSDPLASNNEPGETCTEPVVLENSSFYDCPIKTTTVAVPMPGPVVLPEGFVSPVKERRRLGLSARRSTGRRQTLPVQFAPAVFVTPEDSAKALPAVPVTISAEDADIEVVSEASVQGAPAKSAELALSTSEELPHEYQEDASDDEWEDVVEEEEADSDAENDSDAADTDDPTPSMIDAAVTAQLEAEMDASELEEESSDLPEAAAQDHGMAEDTNTVLQLPSLRDIISERALTSSPIPTLASPHPRLPLRRSPRRAPRRKSTSPLKQSSTTSNLDRPHLVAFTPVRRRPSPPRPDIVSTPDQPATLDALPTSIALQRSTSAPPTEPGMSPIKTARPRISDDTALLQAFLSRAAESKSTRQSITPADLQSTLSTSPHRKAQSSPTSQPHEVLGELDPNSPSPRKSTNFVPESPLSRRSAGPVAVIMEQEEDTMNLDLDESAPRTRSGRTRRRPQPLHSSAQPGPNKISIRGQASTVDIRRTEAQEVALQTRNNTRRNKGQSVLPAIKIKKMTTEDGQDATMLEGEAFHPTRNDIARSQRRLTVSWAETLVAYSGDLVEPDTSVLTVDSATCDDTLTDEAPVVPLAVDTPSKPTMRKLRTNRTAASVTAPPAAEPPTLSSEPSRKPKRTQRRPRAATPAKGLTNASLLPSDLDMEPDPAPALAVEKTAERALVSKRPTSRIPAPASALGQGKENLIISPPKKKMVPSVPSSKTFAPKLEFAKSMNKLTEEAIPGLMSPAKKGGRRPVTFSQSLETKRANGDETVPGLASPAKKRTRRMAA